MVSMCCVLCVVVVTSFSYLTGRKAKIRPAKMANFSALITENASLDAPNVNEWQKSPSSLVFSHVLTFGLKRDIGACVISAEKVCYFYLGRIPGICFSFRKSDFP